MSGPPGVREPHPRRVLIASGDGTSQPAEPPFFAAAVVDGVVRTHGTPACRLGHRVRRGSGQPDDGIFAEWRWDGERLIVTNDRYGMHPLFVAARPDGVRVSPSIGRLIREGAPAELDGDGLSVFLRTGFFVGDDTPFEAIKALPPGARLEWRKDAIRLDRGDAPRGVEDLGREAALDGYVELFRAAIRRRVPADEEVAIPLSGGRDSRHILLELCEQGRRPALCVTAKHYPPYPDEDARVASLLTAAVGLPHVILDQLDRFDAELRKNVATSFCADKHAWTMTLADFLRGRARALFDGIGGDVLSSGLFLTPERQALCDVGRVDALAEALLPTSNDRTLSLVLGADARARLTRDRARRRLATELARHMDAANPIGSFFFWNRTRREIGLVPYAVLSSVGTVFAPYLDHDLYDFLASLPARLLLDRQLHTDAIRRAYPRYRDVPFEDRGARRPDPRPMRREFIRRLAAYARARSRASPSLTRRTYPIVACASVAQRFRDVYPMLNPELMLYLMQLESLAEHPRRDGPE